MKGEFCSGCRAFPSAKRLLRVVYFDYFTSKIVVRALTDRFRSLPPDLAHQLATLICLEIAAAGRAFRRVCR